jgi:hypothetical protein
LLNQTVAGARQHAEGRLAEATQKLEIGSLKYNGEVRPEVFLLVAGKLLEGGGLGNYVRSAAVSTALLDQGRWVPSYCPEPVPIRPASAGWHASLQLVISLWISLGTAAIGLCWWLRDDYLPMVLLVWAIGLTLLVFARYLQRPPRS